MFFAGCRRVAALVVCSAMAIMGCVRNDGENPSNVRTEDGRRHLCYPYIASPERQQQILDGYPQLHPGMFEKEVVGILGAPDERHPTYEAKMSNSRQVGFSYVYLIQRLQESGSVDSMQEKLVRVHFDRAGLLVRVVPVGL